jgi:predicted permease
VLNVLAITSPVFLLIALGYAAIEAGVMAKAAIRPLGAFVLTFALPALIFKSLALRPIAEIANAAYLAAYGGGSLIAYFLMLGLARTQGKSLTGGAIRALGAAVSNSAFIGCPWRWRWRKAALAAEAACAPSSPAQCGALSEIR